MYRACIVVADAGRARLFTFERSLEGEEIREGLVETSDLVDPARRLRPSERYADGPGINRTGNLQYAFDDHRDASKERLEAGFAREVATALAEALRTQTVQRVVVCASPNMLGALRRAGEKLLPADLAVDEVPHDLTKLAPQQLRAQLASYGVLPPPPPRAVA